MSLLFDPSKIQRTVDTDRRHFLASAAALPLVVALSACQQPRLPMRVGSLVFPGYEFLFLAREMGLLNPGQVKLIEMRANTETLRALASGQLEAAALTVDELMSARADGVDLVAIAVLDVSNGADAVLATPGTSLQSLRGKRIGVEDGAVGGVMLAALLDAAGLAASDVRKVPIDLPSSEEVFAKGLVDVVIAAEPWVSRMEQKGAVRIFDSRQIPDRIVDVLAVNRTAMDVHGDALKALVGAHFDALKAFQTNPTQAATVMSARLGVPVSDVPGMFKGMTLPNAEENKAMLAPAGAFDRMTHALQKFMTDAGLMRRTVVLADFVDTRFLPP